MSNSRLVTEVAAAFPGVRRVIDQKEAEAHATAILIALRNVLVLNKGKRVSAHTLWQTMVQVVAEGVLAVDRLGEVK